MPGGRRNASSFDVRANGQGDLLCRVAVETPVRLTSEQKDLLKQFQDLLAQGGDVHNPKASSWFGKVKQFFAN